MLKTLVFALALALQSGHAAPGDSLEMEGTAAAAEHVTLEDLAEFPDRHTGAYVLEGVRVLSCSRFVHDGRATDYALAIEDPAARVTVRDRYVETTFGTVVESETLGDAAVAAAKRNRDLAARVTITVRPTTLLIRAASFEGLVTEIDWLDAAGAVVERAR